LGASVPFRRAILLQESPKQVTLAGYQTSHRVVEGLKEEGLMPQHTEVRSCAYLSEYSTGWKPVASYSHWKWAVPAKASLKPPA
jgi:hypothetical protein